jgi:hypothetical protein
MDDEIKRTNFHAWATISMVLSLVACIFDFGGVFVFSAYYKGYSSVSQPISQLGALGSPIARFVSIWWICIGVLLLFFAIAYEKSNTDRNAYQRMTSWLIAFYAIFEQAGSGIFPGNKIAGHYTTVGLAHNAIGSIGVVALILAPFIIMRKYTKKDDPRIFLFLQAVCYVGIPVFLIFILTHFHLQGLDWINMRHGLWQRMFISVYYLFLIMISVKQFMDTRDPEPESVFNLSQLP